MEGYLGHWEKNLINAMQKCIEDINGGFTQTSVSHIFFNFFAYTDMKSKL